ncbi:potassium channel family protein [Streptomyces spirodelae]|uniref:potassium channel family protein n=1 Tax=Streptomyces spirodelae TaxID=2812904 RepID=UPI0027DB6C7E|nr:potassium channel family protein [Streptomyces spirodelae]
MQWLVTSAGALMVLVTLRDVFHTLWHPTRHAGLSRYVMRGLWELSARLGSHRRAAGIVGPLAMVTVVGTWAFTIILGWALIYWPHLPEAFSFAAGLKPEKHSGLLDALYVSMVTVATLGLGDIAPSAGWLRIVGPAESLVGFALLTATVSWILGIYPALTRRRALALRLSQLRRSGISAQQFEGAAGAALLESLAADVSRVSVDFAQYAESYYFHDGNDRTSLAVNIHHAAELADQGRRARHPDVRMTAAVLSRALEDLADILDRRFLRTGRTEPDVFRAFLDDHGPSGPGLG